MMMITPKHLEDLEVILRTCSSMGDHLNDGIIYEAAKKGLKILSELSTAELPVQGEAAGAVSICHALGGMVEESDGSIHFEGNPNYEITFFSPVFLTIGTKLFTTPPLKPSVNELVEALEFLARHDWDSEDCPAYPDDAIPAVSWIINKVNSYAQKALASHQSAKEQV